MVLVQVNFVGICFEELWVEVVFKCGDEVQCYLFVLGEGGQYSVEILFDDSGLYLVGVWMLLLIDGLSNDFEVGFIKWV